MFQTDSLDSFGQMTSAKPTVITQQMHSQLPYQPVTNANVHNEKTILTKFKPKSD